MNMTKVEASSKRVERKKVNGTRNVLNVSGKDPEYSYRIVNDLGDRVASLTEQGYEVVTDPKVKIGERRVVNPTQEGSVVTASVGGGVKAVLMKIKNEWFQEDQADKARRTAETEMSMKKQASEGMYGKIEISGS
jgi:hypothetical protein